MMGFLTVFWSIWHPYKKMTERLPLFLLGILMPIIERLNSIPQTDCHGLKALDFSPESECDQIIHNSTHRSGNCLEFIFTDTPGIVAGNVSNPATTFDHC